MEKNSTEFLNNNTKVREKEGEAKNKEELIKIIEGINNPKMIKYLLKLIKSFLEIRK